MAQVIFKRYEKKFLLTEEQYEDLRPLIDQFMVPDRYTNYTISNLYYDTDNFELIRTSLKKPKYKEKLRARFYGARADEDSKVFVELKKKFDGVVYKRRVEMSLPEAHEYLSDGIYPEEDSQILREIDYAKNHYGLTAKAYIAYDREAYSGKENPDLRITFDRRIRCRDNHLTFTDGDAGTELLGKNQILMEVKIPGAMPLWMSRAFSIRHIFMTSFSKYGTYYEKYLAEKMIPAPVPVTVGQTSAERSVRYA